MLGLQFKAEASCSDHWIALSQRNGYLHYMSNSAVELLEAFEALPPDYKQLFTVEVLRRTRDLPFDSGPISDEEIGETGRSLFTVLD